MARLQKGRRRITGYRQKRPSYGIGYNKVHVAVNDATRPAYVEVLADQQKSTVISFLARALPWFNASGIESRQVISDSDNSPAYVSEAYAKACPALGLRAHPHHALTPRTNGKADLDRGLLQP